MNFPLVSVVVPCYNHEKYIHECIHSIIGQDYQNIELIVIDDGSKDGSVEKIQELIDTCKNRFVRFEFRSRPNKGLCSTLNEAIEWCEGQYYSAIASDDVMLSGRISKLIRHFEKSDNNKNIVALFSGVSIISESGSILASIHGKERLSDFNNVFRREHSLYAPSAMIKMSSIEKAGGYKNGCSVEDLYMWLKLTEQGGYLYTIPDILVAYRRHTSNTSTQFEEMWKNVSSIMFNYRERSDYIYATAKSMLVQAGDTLGTDKKLSLRWFLRAIMTSKKIIFSYAFYSFIYRFLFIKVPK